MSRHEVYYESVEQYLESLPPEEELSLPELQSEFNELEERLIDTVNKKQEHSEKLIEAKMKNVKDRMTELASNEATNPNWMIRREAEDTNRKHLMN